MSQNNMISFITVTDINDVKIELNSAFIVYMIRDMIETDSGAMIPFTNIALSSGPNIYVMETPEQIAQLQVEAIARTVTVLLPDMIEGFDDVFEE